MGLFRDISTKLEAIVNTIESAPGVKAFDSVVRKPQTDFDNYPAVVIQPSRIESDYSDNANNHRRYIFDIHILNLLEDTAPTTYQARTDDLMDLVDLVLDAIDTTYNLDGVVDFVDPVPSQFFEIATSRGPALVAPIRVVCRKDVMVNRSF